MNLCMRVFVVMSFVTLSCKGMQKDPLEEGVIRVREAIGNRSTSSLMTALENLCNVIALYGSDKLVIKKWSNGENILHMMVYSLADCRGLTSREIGDALLSPGVMAFYHQVFSSACLFSGCSASGYLLRAKAYDGNTALDLFNSIFFEVDPQSPILLIQSQLSEYLFDDVVSFIKTDGSIDRARFDTIINFINKADSRMVASLLLLCTGGNLIHSLLYNAANNIPEWNSAIRNAYEKIFNALKDKFKFEQGRWQMMITYKNRDGQTPEEYFDKNIRTVTCAFKDELFEMAGIDRVKVSQGKSQEVDENISADDASESPAEPPYTFQPKYSPGYLVGKILLGGGIVAVVGTTAFVAWKMFSSDEKEKSA